MDPFVFISMHSFVHSFIQPVFTNLLLDASLGTGQMTGNKIEILALVEELVLVAAEFPSLYYVLGKAENIGISVHTFIIGSWETLRLIAFFYSYEMGWSEKHLWGGK